MADLIDRQWAIKASNGMMHNTNPDDFNAHEKFISFMDDPEIASFGKWQWNNGFNTALVSLKLGLKWLPSMQSEQKHGHWIDYPECLQYDGAYSDEHIVCSKCEHVFNVIDNCTEEFDYCPHCGAKMDEEVTQDGLHSTN